MSRRIFGVRLGVIVLIASLAANAFVAAEYIGRSMAGPPDGRGPILGLGAALRDAPPELRAYARDIRRARRGETREARAAVYAAQIAVADALAAQPFDPEGLSDALEGLRDAATALRSLGDAATIELAEQAPAEFRREIAERLRRRAEARRERAEARDRRAEER